MCAWSFYAILDFLLELQAVVTEIQGNVHNAGSFTLLLNGVSRDSYQAPVNWFRVSMNIPLTKRTTPETREKLLQLMAVYMQIVDHKIQP